MVECRRLGGGRRTPVITSRKAFTLIELLIVIAIIAILSVVVILVLNPAELLRQSRDATRLSDMATLVTALNLYTTNQSTGSLGSSSVVYVSIADPSATSTAGDQCQGLGLTPLPTGYTYHCAASSTIKNVNTLGWMPVAFSAVSGGPPIGNLPIDPTNQTSSNLFYTYTPGTTQYELMALLESSKYQPQAQSDGGYNPAIYEAGTNLATASFSRTVWQNIGDFENSNNGFVTYNGGTQSATMVYGSVTGSYAESVQGTSILAAGNYGGIASLSFPALTVGQKYTLSFYAKAITTPATVFISNQSGGGDQTCFSFSTTFTTLWQPYAITCNLDAVKARLYFWTTTASGQFAIDDLQVIPTP